MDVQQCPCFQLGLAHRRLTRLFEEATAPLGLTIPQAHFLSCLHERDARLAKELARELGLDAGTLTPMIDRLERMGLIRRCPHPEDRRASRICLEPAGRALQPELQNRWQRLSTELAQRLGPTDYDQLLSLLAKIGDESPLTCR